MLESVHYENFKALKDATLPLSRCTLIVGANGSGKTSALQGILLAARGAAYRYDRLATAGATSPDRVKVTLKWGIPHEGIDTWWICQSDSSPIRAHVRGTQAAHRDPALDAKLARIRYYLLEAGAICQPVTLQQQLEMAENGSHLAGVLDQLRDRSPERFEALNNELGRWLPEFDRILFETPGQGQRALMLRTRQGGHAIRAAEVSQGTLLALAILTLAYLPDPPTLVCLEEPDRGLHPRLLRDVRDALYRLSHPENFGEKRAPVQVIATTHSPYMLDLFRDHLDEVVIAVKGDGGVRFERLAGRTDIEDLLQDAHLGEIWYTGILGGTPSKR